MGLTVYHNQALLFVDQNNITSNLKPIACLLRIKNKAGAMIMIRTIQLVMQALLITVLLAACSDDKMAENNKLKNQTPLVEAESMGHESCAAALVSLPAADLASANRNDMSIVRYQQAVSRASQPQPMLERLGWAFVAKARESRDTGYYLMAQQVALCIDSRSPDESASLLLRGHVLHNLHRFDEAEALARRLVEQRGAWFDYALLGDVLVERGMLKEAIDAYQTVVNQRPGPQAYARVAQLRWLKGDLEGALEMMATAVSATSPRTAESAAWMHVRLALLLMQINELSAADAVLSRALTMQAGYPPALHLRGRLLLSQDRITDALPLLKQAVQADPLPEFRWTLYEALTVAGHDSAASEQKAELLRSGEREDRRTFALFLATHGDDSQTALRLAMQELQTRKDIFTLDTVAWALSNAGLNKEALVYSQRALTEGTQDARLFFHAGVVAARAGHRSKALEYLRAARSSQQMLLPSERQRLSEEFVALQPRAHNLADDYLLCQENHIS